VAVGRRKAALILIEHQARHIEKEMFSKRLADKDIEKYFPMYFTGAKALFLNHKNIDIKIKHHEKKIRNHHLKSPKGKKLGLSSQFSSIKAMAFWIPILFLAIWAISLIFAIVTMPK
jgi:hypothetical protein